MKRRKKSKHTLTNIRDGRDGIDFKIPTAEWIQNVCSKFKRRRVDSKKNVFDQKRRYYAMHIYDSFFLIIKIHHSHIQ